MKLRLVHLLALAPLIGLGPVPASAQQPLPAGVVTTVKGEATVVRPTAAQPQTLKLKDALFTRDRIETRQDSIVRVLLGGKAVVTVRELSVFTITDQPGRAIVDLQSGKVALGVAKDRMQPGESIEIRTPNAVAAVRGSLLITEVIPTDRGPQSDFVALQATVPITVAPLSNPALVVGLRVNEAVNVLGTGPATSLGPVRLITPLQAQAARAVATAPKPAEQTEKPPERLTRRVSDEKVSEAAQLGAVITGATPISAAVFAELSGAEQTFTRTQGLIVNDFSKITKFGDATIFSIVTGFAAEPGFRPLFVGGVAPSDEAELGALRAIATEFEIAFSPAILSTGPITLASGERLVSFSGTSTVPFAPVVDLPAADVTATGSAPLFEVAPGTTVGLAGRLVTVDHSTVDIDGAFLSLGAGATLTSETGGLPLLEFISSDVRTGGGMVSLGTGARMSLKRSLLVARGTSFTGGTAPFIALGAGASIELVPTALSLLQLRGGSLTTGGALLSLGEGATVNTSGLVSLFGLLDFGNDTEAGLSTVTTGGHLVRLDRLARVTLGQDLITGDTSTLTVGGSVLSMGPESQLTTNGLSLVFFNDTTITATGSFVSLESGASLVNEGASILGLMSFQNTTVTTGGDFVHLAPGSRITMDRGLLTVSGGSIDSGGSILALDGGATLASGGPSVAPFIIAFNGAIVTSEADVVKLGSGATLVLQRPLLQLSESGAGSRHSLLGLGSGAVLSSPEVTTLALVLPTDSVIATTGDMVRLDSSAQVNMVRPLVNGVRSDLLTEGSILALGGSALFTSSGEADVFVKLDRGHVTAGRGFAEVGAGARLSLGRPMLLGVGTELTLPTGLLSVAPGGQVVSTSSDALVTLTTATQSLATADGAAMFNLAGSTTAVDAESGLVLGTGKPLQTGGSLLFTLAATVNGQTAVKIDTALLEASAPLLNLRATNFTTSRDAVDLTLRAKVTSLGPLVRLDGSTMTVQNGALYNLAGGSFLRVTGDLVELSNGSILTLANGPVLSANGGSAVNVSGSFVAFTGTGGNKVNISNSLCPCTLVSGVPVALRDGAVASNVTIGPNAIKNPSLGTITLGGPSTAAIVLSGPSSKVTIAAP
jgi:hypothetical protein